MNDKDKEAFEKWFSTWNRAEFPGLCMETWQAACDYKQKEIDELEKEKDYLCKKMENMREIYKNAENLRVAIEALEKYDQTPAEADINDVAREALAKIKR